MARQEQNHKERQKYRARFFRLYIVYPAAWIIVSLILFYLVKIG